MKLEALARSLGCELEGDGEVEITAAASIEDAVAGTITFAVNARRAAELSISAASAAILPPGAPSHGKPALRTKRPHLAFARALAILHPAAKPAPGVHPTALVDPSARVDPSASVGPYGVIEAGAAVGARTQVRAFALIGEGVRVGEECVIGSHVVLRARARLGDRVILHDGVVVGADGFGFTPSERGVPEKIPQVGTVVIEDDVEIGALSTVDRATTGATRIGRGVKIDNLVMIGHNSEVGDYSVLASQSGLSGSVKLGRGVQMGGQSGAAGHQSIGDGARIAARGAVAGDVAPGATVAGAPAFPIARWRRAMIALERLPELVHRVRRLERAAGVPPKDDDEK